MSVITRRQKRGQTFIMKTTQQRNLYVIGAGFSAGLGYPLTNDLLIRLWDRADKSFRGELERVIKFHYPGFDCMRFSSFPNVEELLSQIMVNEQLFDASRQGEGKFTKENLKDLQRAFLLEVSDWFHEISKEVRQDRLRFPWLVEFCNQVRRENAVIISFNWDLILDEFLFGACLDKSSYGFSRELFEGPVLLKPHGSLN